MGMGGYLAVQQGSKFPPQFIHLTYTSPQNSGAVKKVALIGKGLTFDSGGYNLKVFFGLRSLSILGWSDLFHRDDEV